MSSHNHVHNAGLPQHVQDISLEIGYEAEFKPRLKVSAQLKKWLMAILAEPATRNLFGFLLLNLSFAFVELFYGMLTNSLGLISDAFHMFFDCTALLAGLVAALVSRWAANDRFSYGYVRAEVIAGFVNALFLLFIAFFIFAEAIERSFEPPEVKHDRLMLISVAGFLVNLVGIFVFHHGGGEHGHSHGEGGASHGHSHSHGGHDAGRKQILQGIFLHILADTLGSVGVIVSSYLIENFGWMMADPVCSMFIAVLIMLSVYPLMKESLSVLMQRTPTSLDNLLAHSLRKVYDLEGVLKIRDQHFWTLCSGSYMGSLRLDVVSGTDTGRLLDTTRRIFVEAGLTDVLVEINSVD